MIEEFDNEEVQLTIQCQRNWDWDNPVSPEDLAILDEYVSKPPQQQGEKLFDIVSIHNNYDAVNILQQICFNPGTYDYNGDPQAHMLCPNVYIWTISPSSNQADMEKIMMQVGMHFGIVTRKAMELGYRTGFVACGPHTATAWRVWCSQHNVACGPQLNENFVVALAVGNPKPGLEYNIDHARGYPHTHNNYNWPTVTKV